MDKAGEGLLELGRALQSASYTFVTPTPETHRRVYDRRAVARDLRDVFGWSRPFARELLPAHWLALLEAAGALEEHGSLLRSRVRYSTLEGGLYVHSAYPTDAVDSVFFGPDTYRFCAFLSRNAPRAERVIDIGCGSGAGGMVAALASGARALVLADVNLRALRYAQVNVHLHARPPAVQFAESDVLGGVEGEFDLIVANPPYMRDPTQRAYRDGGGAHGEALSVRIVREALLRLAPSGTLLLYTGAAIVEGEDVFLRALRPLFEGWTFSYAELDPDVFGEELERPGYEQVERIAAIGLCVRRPA
ncbi:MAG TPA: class I SAM-dependent methyltransferase [Polyangiales bacterium]|nr:class I SAM-dependent methyltransferase [Polyangiales bacterium]